MNGAFLALVILACAVPVLALVVMDRRPIFAAVVAALMFWAGFALVVEAMSGCYPWAPCASHGAKVHKAGPE